MSNQGSITPLPFFFVGKEKTEERVENYESKKRSLLSTALGKPETKNIWYSKEHIAKLLEEVELAGGDGLRIHFGMYEAGHEFEGQLCLLMTTTREVKIGESVVHQNVVMEDEPGFTERSALSKNIEFPSEQSSSSSKYFN